MQHAARLDLHVTAAAPADPAPPDLLRLRDDFSADVPTGRVIGSATPDGVRRGGTDIERIMSIRDGALRIRPLATPGWSRAGIAYGPYRRRNGLGFAVHVLNGDNGSAPYRLPSVIRRLGRWALGSETDGLGTRICRWPFRAKREGIWRRVHCWSKARFAAPGSPAAGNLAIGWFPAETPADPTAAGNAWVVQGAGPDNGHLLCRAGNALQSAVKRLVNVPIHYVVILRETGAAYYVASLPEVAGMAAHPRMRPVAIDATEREPAVFAGMHQSVVGEVGFSVDTVLYGCRIADMPALARWYGTAHAADALTGFGALHGTMAEAGGRWTCTGGPVRTGTGAMCEAGTGLALLSAPEPSGLLHATIEARSDEGEVALVWRAVDDRNHWRLSLDRRGCRLSVVVDGEARLLRDAPSPALEPGRSLSIQLADDGRDIVAHVDGAFLFDAPAAGEIDGTGVGVALAGARGACVRHFEAHPRSVAVPEDLLLDAGWAEAGAETLVDDAFEGERPDLDGHVGPQGFAWRRLMGDGVFALDGTGGARIVASVADPIRVRTAYGVDWPDPGFADIEARILPAGGEGSRDDKARGGLMFWQDERNYIIVNSWLDESHTGEFKHCGAVSSFFYLNGFEDIYDAVWTNVGDRIRRGEPFTFRLTFDGDRYRAAVDGETVLYRALSDIYPAFRGLRIRKVAIVSNWEWGHDTGSRFLSFTARARTGAA